MDITVGEMLHYTKRFKEIINSNASTYIKNVRLAALMTDLERAYQIPMFRNEAFEREHPFLMMLYRTVSEARCL